MKEYIVLDAVKAEDYFEKIDKVLSEHPLDINLKKKLDSLKLVMVEATDIGAEALKAAGFIVQENGKKFAIQG